MDVRRPLPDRWVRYYLGNAPSLVWLLVVNAALFLAGVRYYLETMPEIPTFLWPLYADSPTAVALGTLSLAALLPLLGRNRDVLDAPTNLPLAYLNTLAVVWLVKFGLWTGVALNLRPDLYVAFDLDGLYSYWAILFTHLGYVVEALRIARVGTTTRGALALGLGGLLVGDVYDYVFGNHPPVRYDPGSLFASPLTGDPGHILPFASVLLTFVAVGVAAATLVPHGDTLSETDGLRRR
ncbi:DUF1405 domain-containing protein [Halobium palmae]|uniref:DUF1405 domain-containing protein n=1 Tax=Halobium palmae TaxID=1776492 RepID=A0ABD5RZ78_9EURY